MKNEVKKVLIVQSHSNVIVQLVLFLLHFSYMFIIKILQR